MKFLKYVLCCVAGVLLVAVVFGGLDYAKVTGYAEGYQQGLAEGMCIERFGDFAWTEDQYSVYKAGAKKAMGFRDALKRMVDGPSIPVPFLLDAEPAEEFLDRSEFLD